MNERLQKYFWDVDLKTVDPKRHSRYVIERLVEFGDEGAVRWMLRQYGTKSVLDVVESSRRISQKSKTYWRCVLAGLK